MPQFSRNSLSISCFISSWHRPQKCPWIYPYWDDIISMRGLVIPPQYHRNSILWRTNISHPFFFFFCDRKGKDKLKYKHTQLENRIADCKYFISAKKMKK